MATTFDRLSMLLADQEATDLRIAQTAAEIEEISATITTFADERRVAMPDDDAVLFGESPVPQLDVVEVDPTRAPLAIE
jgi:hypothetical protein